MKKERIKPYDIVKPSSELPDYAKNDNLEERITTTQLDTIYDKYLIKEVNGTRLETINDMFYRVAATVAEGDKKYNASPDNLEKTTKSFYELLSNFYFLPNSPTLMNAGRELGQLSACFVLPVDDSIESICESAKYGAKVHKSGGGTGYDFSKLRSRNSEVKSTKGVASGPISFMRGMFNGYTETIKQGSTRRGANMGILRVDHPDIFEFIYIKQYPEELTNFNLSVALTDSFMEAVKKDDIIYPMNPIKGKKYKLNSENVFTKEEYEEKLKLIDSSPSTKLQKEMNKRLVSSIYKEDNNIYCTFNNKKVGEIRDGEVVYYAKSILESLVECSWENGEPGFIFLDTINKHNPTPEIGEIESTNPCGEQPLLPYESCNLGSIKLSNFVKIEGNKKFIDYVKLEDVVNRAVHFLDNVIDINKYPLDEIRDMTLSNRKIGLGVMGWADMLSRLSIPYESEEAYKLAEEIMGFIQEKSHKKSQELAEERGVFPNWDKSIYKDKGIKMRNATCTTIAPTGTLSLAAGCSGGIEPLFDLYYTHTDAKGNKREVINSFLEEMLIEEDINPDLALREIKEGSSSLQDKPFPNKIKNAFMISDDISPEGHIKTQAAFQKYTDNAVSKTFNFPLETKKEDFEKSIFDLWNLGCKGGTFYRNESRDVQILNKIKGSGKIDKWEPPRIRVGLLYEQPISRSLKGTNKVFGFITIDENGVPRETFFDSNYAMGDEQYMLREKAIDGSFQLREGTADLEKFAERLEMIPPGHGEFQDDFTGEKITHLPDAFKSIYLLKGVSEEVKIDIFSKLGIIQNMIKKKIFDTNKETKESKESKESNNNSLNKEERIRLSQKGKICPKCGEPFRIIGGCPTCGCGSLCG